MTGLGRGLRRLLRANIIADYDQTARVMAQFSRIGGSSKLCL